MNTLLLQGGVIALHLGLPELIDKIYIFLIYFLTIMFNKKVKKKKKENKGRLKATFAFKGARVRISSLV